MKTGLSNLFMDPNLFSQKSFSGVSANHYTLVTYPDEDDEELEEDEDDEDEDVNDNELEDEDDE